MRIGIASGDRISAKKSPDGKPHWGGAGWVRLGQYEHRFHGMGFPTYNGTLVWNRDHFSIDLQDGINRLVDVDVVYLQRLMHKGLSAHIKQARANGQVVINDLDDWYWGLSPTNHAWASSHPKNSPNENINHYRGVLSASDVVTVSTPYLADRIKQFVSCPIEVIPNTVDVARFIVKEHTDETVPTVGWVGSTGHRSNDLEILQGIIDYLHKDGEVLLQHSGYHESHSLVATAWNLPADAVKVVPACDPEDYPSLLTMDIGIAPLNDTPFNHAKSDIKLLEYSASGIPWVGSSLSSYETLRMGWGLGRTAKRPKDWLRHLRALKDPNVRSSEGQALREAVWKRDIGVGTTNLLGFLQSLWT